MGSMDVRSFARAGAAARIKEIQAELASIAKVFPYLQLGSAVSPAMPDGADAGVSARRKRRRKKPRWSAAKRKAVSERMKKYWARRRKAKS